MERWSGKIAVITGASSGIGLAIAKRLVRDGLFVIGLARRIDKMKNEMEYVKRSGEFHAKECDITNEENVIEVFNWIKTTSAPLHILINNAGTICYTKIEDTPTLDLENIFKVNVFGLLYCTKQAIKLMKETQVEAHIINVNSILGHMIPPNWTCSVYPASKYSVTALSEILTNELRDYKIRVTSISPGFVKTEMLDKCLANNRASKDVATLESEDVSNAIIYAFSAPPHVEIKEITLTSKSLGNQMTFSNNENVL